MNPHPRIRQTVKWAGAAVSIALLVLWIESGWRSLDWFSPRGNFVSCAAGRIHILYHEPGNTNPRIVGWNMGTVDGSFEWWFSGSPFSTRVPGITWILFSIPIWPAACITIAITAAAWRLDTLARRRARLNLCPKCNYDRTGLAVGAMCPECGKASVPS